jgi:hypothetical protein
MEYKVLSGPFNAGKLERDLDDRPGCADACSS